METAAIAAVSISYNEARYSNTTFTSKYFAAKRSIVPSAGHVSARSSSQRLSHA
jgi:hypothetical protein